MFDTTHFHSTTHEVLCISAGKATLCKSLNLSVTLVKALQH
jgi:uncharacterized protein YjlB